MKKKKTARRKTVRKKRLAQSHEPVKKRACVRRALPVPPLDRASAPMRLLMLGRTGDDVAQWQQFLSDHGFAPGPVDGFFGGRTRLATVDFQKQHHLVPDGIVGGRTRAVAGPLGFVVQQLGLAIQGIVHDEDDVLGQFGSDVTLFGTRDGSAIYCTAGMQIDADGSYRAYRSRNLGLDLDDNGKDPATPTGRWVSVVTDGFGNPIPQQPQHPAPGYFISTTSLADSTRAITDPLRYVDSENVPYVVLPGGHLGRASLGDYGMVVNTETGKVVHVIAADSGPKNKIGEASIAVARALLGEAASSPRKGGTRRSIIRYVLFPNSKDDIFPASDPRMPAILERTLMHINTQAAMRFASLDPVHQSAFLT